MNLAEAMGQRAEELADGRMLLRQLYAEKHTNGHLMTAPEKIAHQALINETLDDIDTLERAFKTLFIAAEAEINGCILSEAKVNEAVERATQRLLARGELVAG